MNENKKRTSQEINERIRKVDGAMAQEGMPLTEEEKQIIKDCIIGKTTHSIEREKIINRCRSIYG